SRESGGVSGQSLRRVRGGNGAGSQSPEGDAASEGANQKPRPLSHAGTERASGLFDWRQSVCSITGKVTEGWGGDPKRQSNPRWSAAVCGAPAAAGRKQGALDRC